MDSSTERITLRANSLVATVSIQGAWLETLTLASKDILFPKKEFILGGGGTKQRGGCHVCLPNFGPGGDSGLTQHGFGREMLWQKYAVTSDSVTLLLQKGQGAYSHLESKLTYTLGPKSIHMQLDVKNNGDTPLRVSPGFHPYFKTQRPTILLNEREVAADQPYDTEFLNEVPAILRIGDATYRLGSKNLPQWVIWTDHLDTYFCVEPTQAGYAFQDVLNDTDLIASGASGIWNFTIEILE